MCYVLYEEELESNERYVWSYSRNIDDLIEICKQLNSSTGWVLRKFTKSATLIRVFNSPSEASAFINISRGW